MSTQQPKLITELQEAGIKCYGSPPQPPNNTKLWSLVKITPDKFEYEMDDYTIRLVQRDDQPSEDYKEYAVIREDPMENKYRLVESDNLFDVFKLCQGYMIGFEEGDKSIPQA